MNRIVYMCLKNIPRIPSAWFKLCKYAKNPEKYSRTEMANHIRYIMNLAVNSGNINLKITGTEMFPEEDGFMFYGNHQGMFDAVAMLAAIDRPVSAVFKKELKDIPFVKQIVAITGSYAMDREDVRQSMEVIMNTAKAVSEQKRNFIIFPEGTRSKQGNKLLPFKGGTFKSAVKAKCPIVPCALIDSFKPFDQNSIAPVTVKLIYLPPIYYEEYVQMKTTEIAEIVKARIEAAIEEHC